jgi:aspartyl-tRNA(Asn)/glutamyl-tRNA(Gln) amidotransferase subunit B
MTLVDTRTPDPKRFIPGQPPGTWEVIIGMEVHAQVTSESEAVLRSSSTAFGNGAERKRLLGRRGHAGHAAGDQRRMRAAGGADGAGAEGADQPQRSDLRPQELLLSGPAAGLPDLAVQGQPIVGEGIGVPSRSGRIRKAISRISRVGIERLHLEQDAGKSIHDQHPTMSYRGPEPVRRGADGDRVEAGPALVGRGARRICRSCARSCAISGPATATWSEGSMRADVNVSVRRPGGAFGTRCEIKNVNSMRFIGAGHRIRGAPADRLSWRMAAVDRPGNASVRSRAPARRARCAPRRRRTTTATSPIRTSLPLEFDRGVRAAIWPGNLPELPDDKKDRFVNANTACRPMTPSVLVSERANRRIIFEEVAAGRDGKTGGQLGDQRVLLARP